MADGRTFAPRRLGYWFCLFHSSFDPFYSDIAPQSLESKHCAAAISPSCLDASEPRLRNDSSGAAPELVAGDAMGSGEWIRPTLADAIASRSNERVDGFLTGFSEIPVRRGSEF